MWAYGLGLYHVFRQSVYSSWGFRIIHVDCSRFRVQEIHIAHAIFVYFNYNDSTLKVWHNVTTWSTKMFIYYSDEDKYMIEVWVSICTFQLTEKYADNLYTLNDDLIHMVIGFV